MGMGIIFNSWTHTYDNSPRWIRGKDKYWVIDCTELRMYDWLHFMPLIQFNWVLGNISREGSSSVSMSIVTSGKLGLIIDTIRLHEALHVSQRLIDLISNSFHKSEVLSLSNLHSCHWNCW
jgi:hypothetical protein